MIETKSINNAAYLIKHDFLVVMIAPGIVVY